MKTYLVLLSSLMAASLSLADNSQEPSPEIDVEVRFIDICQTTSDSPGLSWQLDESWAKSTASNLDSSDMTYVLSVLERSGSANLLSAPRIRTQSGTNATIKVVTEYRYATDVDIRRVSMTNGEDIVRGVAVVPGNFETRDVGITLNVTPVFDTKRNMIDLNLMAEVVSEPIWKEYTATYEGADGTKQTVAIPQPFFHTRHINQSLSLYNNTTVVIGGMITTGKTRVEDRVPILGAIPWFGRLFRSSHEINEKRNLLITITARTVDDAP